MSICFCTAPATTGALCTGHLTQLRQDLMRTPEILRELDITITNQAKQGGAGTGERMAFNETASGRKDDVLAVLRSAARAADPQLRHRFGETPAEMIARALGKLDALARAAGVHTIARDLSDVLEQAVDAVDRGAERRVLGYCECGQLIVTTKVFGVVWCQVCERDYDVAAWDEQRVRLVQDREATVPELVGYFARDLKAPVSKPTLHRWAADGRITPVDGGCPARFRIRDVMDAWEAVKGRELPGRPKTAQASS